MQAATLRRQEQPSQFESARSQSELDLGISDGATDMGRLLGGGSEDGVECYSANNDAAHPSGAQ